VFCAEAAPGLHLSAVVAAELRIGAANAREHRALEEEVLAPYMRRNRVLSPSARSWEVLGNTLSTLREQEGLQTNHDLALNRPGKTIPPLRKAG